MLDELDIDEVAKRFAEFRPNKEEYFMGDMNDRLTWHHRSTQFILDRLAITRALGLTEEAAKRFHEMSGGDLDK